jgi:antitoxin (DNA-binding transcriptional repressor) of toxin-antitoxin stability system
MEPETITSTEMARNLSEILGQVRYQGKSFRITRGKETVARIVPEKAPKKKGGKPPSGKNLADWFADPNRPRLTEEDARDMMKAVDDMRRLPARVTPIEWD